MKDFFLLLLLLLVPCSLWAQGTYTAASCNQSDVNAVINGPTHTVVRGDTIDIPAGTCTWMSGVNVTAGINIQDDGSGRITAISSNMLAAPSITTGETLNFCETGSTSNTMTDTVTSNKNTTGSLTNHPPDGVDNSSTDFVTYVGDSEPAYIWGNLSSPANVNIADHGSGGCAGTVDSSLNYIVQNRDSFNGSTAKPEWSPYTYPHPLVTGGGGSTTLTAPTFSPAAGTYSGTQTVIISGPSGATICYTTNGTTPAATTEGTCSTGTTYSSAITVSSTETIQALATESGYTNSSVGSGVYAIFINGLDTSKWYIFTGPDTIWVPKYDCFEAANVMVRGGYLVETARTQTVCSGIHYTTADIGWRTYNYTFGVLEYRAKLAGGQGPWPAIWLLGACLQPDSKGINPAACKYPSDSSDSAEVDVSEILNSVHNSVNQETHITGEGVRCIATTTDVSKNWHTYDLIWTSTLMEWLIDGTVTCRTTTTANFPQHAMYLMADIFLGNSGGAIDSSTLPRSTTIDYIRVCQGSTTIPCTQEVASQPGNFDDEFGATPPGKPRPRHWLRLR